MRAGLRLMWWFSKRPPPDRSATRESAAALLECRVGPEPGSPAWCDAGEATRRVWEVLTTNAQAWHGKEDVERSERRGGVLYALGVLAALEPEAVLRAWMAVGMGGWRRPPQ